jgi:GntR family transcriptional repressor for pyruvate dehydrogenase complex
MENEVSQDGPIFDALPRQATLANRVVRQMEIMIARGGLPIGGKLPPERDLAAQFGVSRTVVREAVAALSARGLLEVQSGSGTIVRRPSIESIASLLNLYMESGPYGPDINQAHDALRILLAEIAGVASEKRTDEDIENLSRIARTGAENMDPQAARDYFFALAQATHNSLFMMVYDCVIAVAPAALSSEDSIRAIKYLRSITEEIRKGDVKSSRKAIRDCFSEAAETTKPAKSKKS